MGEFYGVMRHAERFRKGVKDSKRSKQHDKLTEDGVTATRLVGRRFKEFLDETEPPQKQITIYYVDTEESRQTADVLSKELGERASRSCLRLTTLSPKAIPTHDPLAHDKLADQLESELDGNEPMVIVGNDPQTTWMAQAGLRRRALTFSLSRSEMVWRDRPRRRGQRWDGDHHFRRNVDLEWVFSPSDPKSTDQIRDKIVSKMNSAKVLGTFLTALFAFAAREVLTDADSHSMTYVALAGLGLAFLALSIVLFFTALYRYDSLLMPSRFWASRPGRRGGGYVRRPPASDVLVLAQSMVRIWNRLFTSAMVSAGLGVVLLAMAFSDPENGGDWFQIGAILAAVALLAAAIASWSRPGLGTND